MILNRSSMFKLTALFAAVVIITGCRANGGFTLGKNKSPAQVADANATETFVGGAGQSDQFATASNKIGARDVYYFSFDSSQVAQEDAARIKQHGTYLASNQSAKVKLEGNTDQRGSPEYNIGLGHRRADSVAQAMQSQGASANQIETVSYGAERPAAQGSDEEAYSKNRRVDLAYQASAPEATEKQG